MPSIDSGIRILVYGIEKLSQPLPKLPFVHRTSLFELEFEPLNTSKRFQDYHGVILFQSTFETVRRVETYSGIYYEVKCNSDELIKRRNELRQLLEKGGFVCFLLYTDFVYSSGGMTYLDTDLVKLVLNDSSVLPEPFSRSLPVDKVDRPEFETFLGDYGNVRTAFSHYTLSDPALREICSVGDRTTGFILFNQMYFVPCRVFQSHEIEDFFTKIATALVSTSKKLIQEIPPWADQYNFPAENELSKKEVELENQLRDIRSQQSIWRNYKRCLCYDSELLVESVAQVLSQGLGLKILQESDSKIEDKVLLNEKGEDIALVEIKGTNENIKSPNIYQADSHRGRRNKPDDFPSLLIVNTFIKSSNSVADKQRDVEPIQIDLSVKKKVLMMRTIDLLNLLHLKEQGKVDKQTVTEIFRTHVGWLKVSQEGYEVVHP